MNASNDVAALEAALGYRFQNRALLTMALTHRSFGATHNERLEFLGDSVLDCAMAAALYARFPDAPEGDLSRLRANLVKQDALHKIAQDLKLGDYLRLGDGEKQSGGKARPSILADALEALLGAIYLDAGFDRAAAVLTPLIADQFAAVAPGQAMKDAKTRLQEWLQARRHPLPQYQVQEVSGAAHDQRFCVACQIAALSLVTTGSGVSRRQAEQAAAAAALAQLENRT